MKRRRILCDRCHRPKPQTCLCDSLPPPTSNKIELHRTEIVVLQHPLEVKNHKAASHRSVPLLELVLNESSLTLCTGRRLGEESLGQELLNRIRYRYQKNTVKKEECCNDNKDNTNNNNDNDDNEECLPILVFPKIKVSVNDINANANATNEYYREDEATVLSLKGLLKKLHNDDGNDDDNNNIDNNNTSNDNIDNPDNDDSAVVLVPRKPPLPPNKNNKRHKKIVLLVLDATWRHAREMHIANIKAGMYPPHMLRLALEKEDLCFDDEDDNDNADNDNSSASAAFRPGRFRLRGKASKKGYKKQKKKDVDDDNNNNNNNGGNGNGNGCDDNDEPIDETWMSTAECIAWIVSKLEATTGTSNNNSSSKYNCNNEHKQCNNSNESLSGSDLYEILMKPLDAMVNKWKSYMDKAAACKNSKRQKQDPKQQQQKQQQQKQQQQQNKIEKE